jgi:hypothetical protein
MLNEFVSKIFVHEADKSSGERVQRIDIHFNFIGNFDIPTIDVPPTTEEIEAEKNRIAKLEWQRDANRRLYASKKAALELQRALDAGEITQAEFDAIEREKLAVEESKKAEQSERTKENQRKYRREWAKRDRAKKKAAQTVVAV